MTRRHVVGCAFLGLIFGGCAWFGWRYLLSNNASVYVSEHPQVQREDGRVELSADKLTALNIECTNVRTAEMQELRTVPARIQYDDSRRVDVKAATAGSVIEMNVKPSDWVTAGQILCKLSSPEVGDVRSTVLQRQDELNVLDEQVKWVEQTNDGLKKLVDDIAARQSIERIRKEYRDVLLGKDRNVLLSAYSRFLLADVSSKNLERLRESGAVSERTVLDARKEMESAEAALIGTTEQSLFDIRQESLQVRAAANAARRKLHISQQQLTTLLGYEQSLETLREHAKSGPHLSLVEVRAPIDGTVERKMFALSERVSLGASLFLLADTSQLWVAADLREQEWSALSLKAGDTVDVTIPAIPYQTFQASVHYIGREVSPDTNAVPLIAKISNETRTLRPGLFARMELKLSEGHQSLTVPESAISVHERKSFVFVPEGDHAFQRVFVTTGLRQGDQVEILDGLSAGDCVATSGVNKLKAELLLEREP